MIKTECCGQAPSVQADVLIKGSMPDILTLECKLPIRAAAAPNASCAL